MARSASIFIASLALLAGCGVIVAEEPGDSLPSAPLSFVLLDPDGDGVVPRSDWEAYGDAFFMVLDRNGDGIIRERELRDAFADFDIDGNGVLARDEIDVGLLDRDDDGLITRSEWNAGVLLKGLDVNRSGGVTVNEMRVRRHDTFTVLDGNATERVAWREAVAGQRPFTLFRF